MESATNQDIPLDAKSERCVSFLVLGQSGSGKTTLINAFVNHFNKKEYSSEKLILIPQKKGQECSFDDYKDLVDPAEVMEGNYGKSKTQKFNLYKIANDERTMLIMDTPGIGDTRGIEQDKENIKNIIRGLNSVNENVFIQAIIFVAGNDCRETSLFKYYLEEIKKIMTKPCIDQTIVVSTKEDGDFPNELKSMITDGLGIALPEDRWFTMQNKPFLEKVGTDNKRYRGLEDTWEIGRETFEKIYTTAAQFDKIVTKDMDELFIKRRQLEETMDKRIGRIEALRGLEQKGERIRQEQEETEQGKTLFKNQEEKTKHQKFSLNVNYNCNTCHRVCIPNTTRIGYTIKSILTFSLYHWYREKSPCSICRHTNSEHVYENVERFVGLDSLSKEILAEIEKEALDLRKKRLTNEELVNEVKIKMEENMKDLVQLRNDIGRLGIVSIKYDAYIDYLKELIKNSENSVQKEELEKHKRKYEKIKEEYEDANA